MPRPGFYTGVDSESVRLKDNNDPGTQDQRKAWRRAITQEQEDTKAQLAQGSTLADLGILNQKEEGRARFNFFGGEEGAKKQGEEMGAYLANKNASFGHWNKNADGTFSDPDGLGGVRATYDQYGRKLTGTAKAGSFGSGTWKGGPGGATGQPTRSNLTGTPAANPNSQPLPPGATGGPVTMESVLQRILEGKDGSYNPTVVQQLEGRATRSAANQRAQAKTALDADAIRRGVFNSKTSGAALQRANREIDAGRSGEVANIGMRAAETGFQEKIGALDRMQKSLQDQRNYALALQGNELQKQQMLAQIDLANRRISEERNALSSRMDFDREMAYTQNQWSNERWQQELPFRTSQFETGLLR